MRAWPSTQCELPLGNAPLSHCRDSLKMVRSRFERIYRTDGAGFRSEWFRTSQRRKPGQCSPLLYQCVRPETLRPRGNFALQTNFCGVTTPNSQRTDTLYVRNDAVVPGHRITATPHLAGRQGPIRSDKCHPAEFWSVGRFGGYDPRNAGRNA